MSRMPKSPLILRHRFALGDAVCLTALARDIQLAYPDRYDLYVDTHFRDAWHHNPHATVITDEIRNRLKNPRQVSISYVRGITMAGRGNKIHMVSAYHDDFKRHTGIPVPVTFPGGDIHFSEAEKATFMPGSYWVVMAGGKEDLTNKYWWHDRWQEMVDRLAAQGVHCVQAGATHDRHHHKYLNNVTNMVGKTPTVRDFYRLIRDSAGVICPITGAMHIAAALNKPCVVVAGGREEPWWFGYTNEFRAWGPACPPVQVEHRLLHTVGKLHCSDKKGCWKKRVVAMDANDRGAGARTLCKEPVCRGTENVAKCMDMISVDDVVEAVLSYQAPKTATVKPLQRLTVLSGFGLEDEPAPAPVVVIPAAAPVPVTAYYGTLTPASSLDHPILGGKITVCVLCFGNYPQLAKTCLGSILNTVPIDRLDLRVACNACCKDTLDYIATLPTTVTYINDGNDKKYPVMRRMFNDPEHPITTKYLVWFDDDTFVVDPSWLSKLTDTIVANHPHGVRLYGWKMVHDLGIYAKGGHNPKRWFEQAPWWRGRPLQIRGSERTAPNGSVIPFVAGWFWAIATDTIKACDIPDRRLAHNGGDVAISAQVYQGGFKIKTINNNKTLISCPSKEAGGRRGFSERFQWSNP
jgi:ADP-heptose:LPS heptosyltransferase